MAIVSVFISIYSIFIISIVSMAGKAEISKELDGVGLNGMTVSAYNSFNENITDTDIYNILADNKSITKITPVLYDTAIITFNTGSEQQVVCWGISPTAKDIVNLQQIHGRFFSEADIDNSSFVCMIDENVAQSAYGRSNIVGKDLYLSMEQGIYKFTIVGIVNKTSNILNGMSGHVIPEFIYIPFTVMENICQKKNIDQIIVNVTDNNTTEDELRKYLLSETDIPRGARFDINNLSRQRETITNIVELAFLALFAVSSIAIVVCSISVGISVNTAVIQSIHDIGIKLSLGARKAEIMSEFLLYSLFACVLGIATGSAAGFFTQMIVNFVLKKEYMFDLALLMTGIFATIILTIIFSLYPSYQAASLLPVKALNRE